MYNYNKKIPKVTCPPGKVAFIPLKKSRFTFPSEFKNVVVSEPGEPVKKESIAWPDAQKVLIPGTVNGAAAKERLANFEWPGDAPIYIDPKEDPDKYRFLHLCPFNGTSPSFRNAKRYTKEREINNEPLDLNLALFVEVNEESEGLARMKQRVWMTKAMAMLQETIGTFDPETEEVKLKPKAAEKLEKISYYLNQAPVYGGKMAQYAVVQDMASSPRTAKKVYEAISEYAKIDIKVTFSELIENNVISLRGAIYYFGETALGREDAVLAKLDPESKEHAAIRETMLKVLADKKSQ
ncbi:hypothetical protein [uncultured Sphaerochaeta sp.]|uniref:hypothetical protein n=1 Tax=uncultured Sphaerochaeta sp. TaxID=886478 RepID=UPI00261A0115|nr:hypothetical protein [uncultured Sphaerochaeta sp.]